jgi:FKBP-type peptidyl-prolyl cis-trans isomerase
VATALIVFCAGCGGRSSSSTSASSGTSSTATTATTPTTSTTPTTATSTLPSTTTRPATPGVIAEPFKRPPNPGPHHGAKVRHLVIKDIVRGRGPELHLGDTGIFDFIASNWITGRQIESSWQRPRPFETQIERNVVIGGWWKGIPGMRVGGRRKLILPPSLGFPPGTAPEVQGATLFYDVVLLGVIAKRPAGVGGGATTASGQ